MDKKKFMIIGMIGILAIATVIVAADWPGLRPRADLACYVERSLDGGGIDTNIKAGSCGGSGPGSPCRGTYPSISCSEPTKKKCIESTGGGGAYACVHECANGASGYEYQPRYECGVSCTDEDCSVIGV